MNQLKSIKIDYLHLPVLYLIRNNQTSLTELDLNFLNYSTDKEIDELSETLGSLTKLKQLKLTTDNYLIRDIRILTSILKLGNIEKLELPGLFDRKEIGYKIYTHKQSKENIIDEHVYDIYKYVNEEVNEEMYYEVANLIRRRNTKYNQRYEENFISRLKNSRHIYHEGNKYVKELDKFINEINSGDKLKTCFKNLCNVIDYSSSSDCSYCNRSDFVEDESESKSDTSSNDPESERVEKYKLSTKLNQYPSKNLTSDKYSLEYCLSDIMNVDYFISNINKLNKLKQFSCGDTFIKRHLKTLLDNSYT